MMIRIVLVVAADRRGLIGRDGGLPWHLPSELKRFKAATIGHPCLMGRRTWESIGRPLPGRDMIVLTRGSAIATPGIITVATLAAGLAEAERCAAVRGFDRVMVIGGGEIYRQTLPLADRVLYTEVDAELTGDTQFPTLTPEDWTETSAERHEAEARDQFDYTIRVYDRRRSPPVR
jgi:dihydrofolate reductase